jgi:hypothetical protein
MAVGAWISGAAVAATPVEPVDKLGHTPEQAAFWARFEEARRYVWKRADVARRVAASPARAEVEAILDDLRFGAYEAPPDVPAMLAFDVALHGAMADGAFDGAEVEALRALGAGFRERVSPSRRTELLEIHVAESGLASPTHPFVRTHPPGDPDEPGPEAVGSRLAELTDATLGRHLAEAGWPASCHDGAPWEYLSCKGSQGGQDIADVWLRRYPTETRLRDAIRLWSDEVWTRDATAVLEVSVLRAADAVAVRDAILARALPGPPERARRVEPTIFARVGDGDRRTLDEAALRAGIAAAGFTVDLCRSGSDTGFYLECGFSRGDRHGTANVEAVPDGARLRTEVSNGRALWGGEWGALVVEVREEAAARALLDALDPPR